MTPSAMPASEAARYEVMVREVRQLWEQTRRDAAEIAALRAALEDANRSVVAAVAEARREGMLRAAEIVEVRRHDMLPLSDAQWNAACQVGAAAIRAAASEDEA